MSVLQFEISKLCNKMKTTLNKINSLNLSRNEIILAPGFNAFPCMFMIRSNEKQNPAWVDNINLLKAIHCILSDQLTLYYR